MHVVAFRGCNEEVGRLRVPCIYVREHTVVADVPHFDIRRDVFIGVNAVPYCSSLWSVLFGVPLGTRRWW